MARYILFVVCFLAIRFLWSDNCIDEYCMEFWQKGKEVPYWRERPYPYPLPFEKLSLDDTKENIAMIERQILQDWSSDDCLLALRILVMRDMQKKIETQPWSKNLSTGSDPSDSIESNDFWQTVLFANYFVEKFRDKLKTRLEILDIDPNSKLKEIVRAFLPKKCERPRTHYGIFYIGTHS